MSLFQFLMLAASAFFAYKIYEHVQSLKDETDEVDEESRSADAFSPFDPESLMQKADEAFEQEEYDKALSLLEEANVKRANDSDILFKLGYISNLKGDSSSALDYYKEALEYDKENEFIHNALASLYRNNAEFASAKMHLQASIELDGQNPHTYYNYGNLLVDMKYDDEAKEMYQKALELDPDFTEAKEELERLG